MKCFLKLVPLPVIMLTLVNLHAQGTIKALKPGDVLPVIQSQTLNKMADPKFRRSNSNHKFFLLHFWNRGCRSSEKVIPELEQLQERFAGSFQLVVISPPGTQRPESNGRPSEPKTINIKDDTSFHKMFPHVSVPHHVWVSAKGRVEFITEPFNLNEKNITRFLKGEKLNLIERREDSIYSMEKFLWAKLGTEKPEYLHSSLTISRWLPGVSSGSSRKLDSLGGLISFRMINQSLLSLYKAAFGNQRDFQFNNRIILEMADTSPFHMPEDQSAWNEWIPANLYCYERLLPLAKWPELYSTMARDLENEFGYRCEIENRFVSCLILRNIARSDSAPEGKSYTKKVGDTLFIRNTSTKKLAGSFRFLLEGLPQPFLDETDNRSIDIDLIFKPDVNLLNQQLKAVGLEFQVEERCIPMLVIQKATLN